MNTYKILKSNNNIDFLFCEKTNDIYLIDIDSNNFFKYLENKNGFISEEDFYCSNGSMKTVDISEQTHYIETYAHPTNIFNYVVEDLKKQGSSDETIKYVIKEMLEISHIYYYGMDLTDFEVLTFYQNKKDTIEKELENLLY